MRLENLAVDTIRQSLTTNFRNPCKCPEPATFAVPQPPRQFEAFGVRFMGPARASRLTLSFAAHVVIISSADGASVGGNLWPELSALLSDGAGNVLALHLTLVVDDDTSGVLEVQEMTLTSADGLALSDDDSGHNLLSQLGRTLLDGGEEHVANGTSGHAGHSWTDASTGNHIQVLSTSVVSAVDDRSNWQTVGDL